MLRLPHPMCTEYCQTNINDSLLCTLCVRGVWLWQPMQSTATPSPSPPATSAATPPSHNTPGRGDHNHVIHSSTRVHHRLQLSRQLLWTHVAVAVHEPLLKCFKDGLHCQWPVQVDQIKVVFPCHGSRQLVHSS